MKRLLLLAFFVLLFVTGLAGGFVAYDQYASEVNLTVRIIDSGDGRPVKDARVSLRPAPAAPATVGEDGTFRLQRVRRRTVVHVEASEYLPTSVTIDRAGDLEVPLVPRSLSGTVRDAYSQMPVSQAVVVAGPVSVTTELAGAYYFTRLAEGTRLFASAPGYFPAEFDPPNSPDLDLFLRPDHLIGKVTEMDTGKPVAGAYIDAGVITMTTSISGTFRIDNLPPSLTLSVMAPGYRRQQIAVEQQSQIDIALEPHPIKAPYITFFGIGNQALRQRLIDLIETTELNAIVIDIKGDRGLVAYPSEVPLAKEIGAQSFISLPDAEELLASLKKKGIYTIARIVVFKDDPLGRAHPEWAIKDGKTGGTWVDGEGLVWVDPFRREVWDYNLALAKEAIRKGFDEVQFDYIRFPTDPSSGTSVDRAQYSRPSNPQSRVEAISGFLALARSELRPMGGFLSIDTFGYTCWREDEMGIGQKLEALAPYVDYISPMVYPSTFAGGLPTDPPTYQNAPAYPYEIVYYSLEKAVKRTAGSNARIRPWLQYFDDYPWATAKVYTEADIQAQKKAAKDAGVTGWLLWDPFVDYDKGGLKKREAPAPGGR